MPHLKDIKGVGPKTLEKFNNLGIKTVKDLLFSFPVKYDNHRFDSFDNRAINNELTLEAKIYSKPKLYFIRRNLDRLSFQVEIDRIIFNVNIFNRKFLFKSLAIGEDIVITGKFLNNFSSFTANNIVLKRNYKTGIIPIYGFKNIKEGTASKIIKEVLSYDYLLNESLPNWILKKHEIPNINSLINKIHFPKNENEIYQSRKRIIYEELFNFAIKVEYLKKINKTVYTPIKKYDINLIKDFINTLDFELTKDQKSATNDIFRDLKSKNQMNRLLQGDVGSGKTIVSIIASLAVVSANYQVALMVPTLVLAKQHFDTYKNYLKKYNINIALLTSDLTVSSKRKIYSDIKNNKINIIIGTHALIQEDVDFHNLGFIVIDEQHRFGVNQRKELRLKGANPDILLMSATPIPRTLAISIYQDIDISFIQEKPAGRKEVVTDIISYENLNIVLDKIKKELDDSFQVYFICPKIEENETSNKISVKELYNYLKSKLDNKYKIGVLHGKMRDNQKVEIINDFYSNKINILVSTTVIEVGVNVLNATVMVILNADSFGLAQLHQLRGRIGRKNQQAFCYLIVDDILKENERLNILKETNDGFLISEYDLKIRGSGEVFGKSQSGIPVFKMANLINDIEILNKAFLDASIIINSRESNSKLLINKAIKSIDSYILD